MRCSTREAGVLLRASIRQDRLPVEVDRILDLRVNVPASTEQVLLLGPADVAARAHRASYHRVDVTATTRGDRSLSSGARLCPVVAAAHRSEEEAARLLNHSPAPSG